MASKKYLIRGREYTQTAAERVARAIKDNGAVGSFLNEHELDFYNQYFKLWRDEDEQFECVKIERCPEKFAGKKIGLMVTDSTGFRTQRTYRAGKIPHVQRVKQAFRYAIANQIDDFSRTHYAYSCGICGWPLGLDIHVDHYDMTFNDAFKSFTRNMDVSKIDIIPNHERGGRILVDKQLSDDWNEYHRHNTNLRFTHAKCNLTRKS